jgi:Raf kinase inhibitor-like YbhB/YbcL family protein
MAGIEMRSTAFKDQDRMPERLARSAGNISPPLEWSKAPEGSRELVLLVEDPEGGRVPFVHWLVTGIDPLSTGVAEGSIPSAGREWPNSFGDVGWGGPQPPVGDDPHRYLFRLFAVAEPLPLPDMPTASQVLQAAQDRELASGVIVGTFAR